MKKIATFYSNHMLQVSKNFFYVASILLSLSTVCKGQGMAGHSQLQEKATIQVSLKEAAARLKKSKKSTLVTSLQTNMKWVVGSFVGFLVALFSFFVYYKWQEEGSDLGSSSGDEDPSSKLRLATDDNNNHSPLSRTEMLKIKELANIIKHGNPKIVCFTGAGISTNAGILDFRSKGGFYDKVIEYYEKHNKALPDILDSAQDFYTDQYLRGYPKDFYDILESSGKFKSAQPTYTHYFIKLLADKGILSKYYTQNVDALEDKAGVPAEKVHRYHGGTGDGGHCVECKQYSKEEECHYKGKVPTCCKQKDGKICGGMMKPGTVVFFQDTVFTDPNAERITKEADIVIILGTRLTVWPFYTIPDGADEKAYRLFITKELSETVKNKFKRPRDTIIFNDCDFVVSQLVKLIGWEDDMKRIIS